MGAIKTVEPPVFGGLALRYAAFMQGLRDAIDARIRTTLEGDKRAIATALLTGRRDAITTPVNDAMFISGLGHVLSICGYHMAVVAGVVFFAVRALLALIPAGVRRFPSKRSSIRYAMGRENRRNLRSGGQPTMSKRLSFQAISSTTWQTGSSIRRRFERYRMTRFRRLPRRWGCSLLSPPAGRVFRTMNCSDLARMPSQSSLGMRGLDWTKRRRGLAVSFAREGLWGSDLEHLKHPQTSMQRRCRGSTLK